MHNILLDCLALLAPLGALALVIYRTLATSVLVFPDPASPAYNTGDYYRYVNMALPYGDPRYVFHQPFLYRILVPGTVHLLSMIGLPFRTSFFSITVMSLTVATLGIFFLVRGIGLSRGTAMGAALVYVTLQWAVAYNVRDYFLVDPATHAFFVMILLAAQRRQRTLVVVLATVGVVCKESIYLPIVFTAVQWLIPALRPLSARLGELTSGRVLAVIQRVPRGTWGWVAALVLLPLTATQIVQHVIHLYYPPLSLVHVWKHYIPEHFQPNKISGLYNTVARSTWGTFGVFFALCVAALMTKRWRQTGWSGWALVAASLIILYSYTVSGDAERLSINAWPFVIVIGAVMIDTLSKALRVPAALLWGVALLAQFLYEPLLGPPGAGILGPLAPVAHLIGFPLMATVSLVIIALTLLNYRKVLPFPQVAVAGPPIAVPLAAADDIVDGHGHTQQRPDLTGQALGPLPGDSDSVFWSKTHGGVMALNSSAVWIAAMRLHELTEACVFPLALQLHNLPPAQHTLAAPADPALDTLVARWRGGSNPQRLWQAYQTLIADYRGLRDQVRVPPSPMPQLEQGVKALVDVATRQPAGASSEVVSWRSLSIVLPAYNEELAISETVQKCLRATRRLCPNTEVIVVDDGSRDRTGQIAEDFAARDARVVVVHNRPNRGYGGALLAGFAAARGELLFFMDSDGQFDINDIATLLAAYEQHPGAAILGYRAHRRDKFLRRVNAWGWKKLVGVVLGLHGIKDIDCAFKVFPATAFRACQVTAQGAMVNTEMLLKFQKMGLAVIQVPVQHFARTVGVATGANPGVIVKAFREMLRLRLRLHTWKPADERTPPRDS